MLDHVRKRQEELRKGLTNTIGGDVLSQEDLEKSAGDYFEKAKVTHPIGAIKDFGGRSYIKTASGWKYHGKGTGAKAQEHASAAKPTEVKKQPAASHKTGDDVSWTSGGAKYSGTVVGGDDSNGYEVKVNAGQSWQKFHKVELSQITKKEEPSAFTKQVTEAKERSKNDMAHQDNTQHAKKDKPSGLKQKPVVEDQVQSHQSKVRKQITETYKKKVKLGEGTQGVVHDLRNGRVEKTFYDTTKSAKNIKAYKNLMTDSEHFVRVHSVDEKNGVVVMDKLTPLKDSEFKDVMDKLHKMHVDPTELLENPEENQIIISRFKSPQEKKAITEFINLITQVNEEGHKLGINVNDFHSSNFGRDKSGKIRMFDPTW